MMTLSLLFALTLTADINRIAAQTDASVGISAVNLETGRSVAIRGDERFPMGSVFKFPVALEVLHQADRAGVLCATARTTSRSRSRMRSFSTPCSATELTR